MPKDEVNALKSEVNTLKGLLAEKERELAQLKDTSDWAPREGLYVRVVDDFGREIAVGVIHELHNLEDDSSKVPDRAMFTYFDERFNHRTVAVALSACRPL